MSYMKRHLEEIQHHLDKRDWQKALELLQPWGDDVANQLLGTVENLAMNQELEENGPLNWNLDVVIPREMSQELYDTQSLIELFTQLQRDGYSGLGLGLIVDLIRRDASKIN